MVGDTWKLTLGICKSKAYGRLAITNSNQNFLVKTTSILEMQGENRIRFTQLEVIKTYNVTPNQILLIKQVPNNLLRDLILSLLPLLSSPSTEIK